MDKHWSFAQECQSQVWRRMPYLHKEILPNSLIWKLCSPRVILYLLRCCFFIAEEVWTDSYLFVLLKYHHFLRCFVLKFLRKIIFIFIIFFKTKVPDGSVWIVWMQANANTNGRARHNRARVAVTKCPRGLSAGPEPDDWEFDQWNGKVRVNFCSVWN